jgi:SPP1 gp7 family putative phage head morphogenesis protein
MNFDDFRPILRNTRLYLADLEAFVEKFIPWSILTGHEPRLVLPSLEDDAIREAAETIARRMLYRVAKTNATSWRAAARESLHSRRIYEALRTEMNGSVGVRVNELIADNARLILGLPDDLAQRTAAYVGREQRRGLRASEISKALAEKLPQVAQSRAKLIARTEVGKAETALTEARAERLGLAYYEWATSEDQRVRPSHRQMDKVLVAWSDPPSPEQLAGEPSKAGRYAPGGVWNCRCIALPLIDLDEVRWPHKVYGHGRIEMVSRREFERFVDLPKVA